MVELTWHVPDCTIQKNDKPKVSKRKERAFWKTSILAMKCAKWQQTFIMALQN